MTPIDLTTVELGPEHAPLILDAAADWLSVPGRRCKGEYVKGDRCCAWGAIFKVAGCVAMSSRADDVVDPLVRPHISRALDSDDIGFPGLVFFNDSTRDTRKVVRALRRAARIARQYVPAVAA